MIPFLAWPADERSIRKINRTEGQLVFTFYSRFYFSDLKLSSGNIGILIDLFY